MAGRCAWVLNLDAELELAAPRAYRPTREVAALVEAGLERARAILAPEDVLVREGERLPEGVAWRGRAWCPTPRALRLLRSAGAEPEPAPPLDVLRTVNAREFSEPFGDPLPDAGFAREPAELARILARRPPDAPWLLKRAFGVAGRGQRRASRARWTAADDTWVARSFAQGALRAEPRVAIELETVTHGRVDPDRRVQVAAPCIQACRPDGAWSETRAPLAGELSDEIREALEAAARELGVALAAAGYFGPFGVDGYVWRNEPGHHQLNPRSELNARYTMGWHLSAPAFERK